MNDQASTYAPFLMLAEIVTNRSEAEAVLFQIADEGTFWLGIERIMNHLQIAQGFLETVVLSFANSQKLIEANNRKMDLDAMSLSQLHVALEVRYHYLFPLEEAAIAARLMTEWGEPGKDAVRTLANQSEQRSRLLRRLGQSEPSW